MRALARAASIVAVAAVALATAGADGVAAPHRPTRRAPAPPTTSAKGADVVALRAPKSSEVLVRGGTFTMGASDAEVAHAVAICKYEDRVRRGADPNAETTPEDDLDCSDDAFRFETPAHEVFLSDFWIDRTEVTVARFRRCVAAGRCSEPPYAAGAARFDRADLPVVLVTHADALGFCAWAGGRLPTEAEWERAAKGSTSRRYPWGNVYNPLLSNHGRLADDRTDAIDGFLELAPVASFPEGRTLDGLEDMAGNAGEWVSDWFAKEYPKVSAVNPPGPAEGEVRVVRGGTYLQSRPWLRTTSRYYEAPGARRSWIGFRCVRPAR